MAIDISTHTLVQTIYVVAIIHIIVSFWGSFCSLACGLKVPVIIKAKDACDPTYYNYAYPRVFWWLSFLAYLVLTIASGILLFDRFKEKPRNASEKITKNQIITLFGLSVAHLFVSFILITCISYISKEETRIQVQTLPWFLSLSVVIAMVILSKHVLDKV